VVEFEVKCALHSSYGVFEVVAVVLANGSKIYTGPVRYSMVTPVRLEAPEKLITLDREVNATFMYWEDEVTGERVKEPAVEVTSIS